MVSATRLSLRPCIVPAEEDEPISRHRAGDRYPRSNTARTVVRRGVKPSNDNRPHPESKSRIVQATKLKGRRKAAACIDDGTEAPPEIKAFLARSPHGTPPPKKPGDGQ